MTFKEATSASSGINIIGDYNSIYNSTFFNISGAAIAIQDWSNDNNITNNSIYNNSEGLHFYGDPEKIELLFPEELHPDELYFHKYDEFEF